MDPADGPVPSDKARAESVSGAAGQIKSDFIFSKRGVGRMPPQKTSQWRIQGELTIYLS